MPPELLEKLEISMPVKRRDPHYFLPTTDSRYLLFGSDETRMAEQFKRFFSAADWVANQRLQTEIAQLREDIGPTWLQAPLSIEATAERFVRPALRQPFIDLCRGSVADYLARFGFESDLLMAMYAVTDGFSGLNATWDTPGTGMNFLIHNMCRLPGADGTWMVVEGGMGTVSRRIADAAVAAGVTIETGCSVAEICVSQGQTTGVVTQTGERIDATAVVVGADPYRLRDLAGRDNFPADFNSWLDGTMKDGTTFKLNLALSGLPNFSCLPDGDHGQYNGTIHLLPDEDIVIDTLIDGFEAVKQGRLAEFPSIEWYIHTTVDPTLQDADGNHNSALFVQWVPYELSESSWEAEESRYAAHLLSICDRFAPGTSDLVVDMFPLHPKKIEAHFGMTRGHIHHIDNAYGFSDRMPYASPISGLYSASAGTHPAGSVIGAAGHNAAMRVLSDMDIGSGGS